MKKKIYLAIPFSGIEDLSFRVANEVASLLIQQGHFVFSPISHSYPIWKTEMVPHTYEVWLDQDKEFVKWADEVWAINIMGRNGMDLIEKSIGVNVEMEWGHEQEKPVRIISYNPETRELSSPSLVLKIA